MLGAGTESTVESIDLIQHGRVLAFDLGARRVGVAVSDENRIAVRPLENITRTSWKKLLVDIRQLVARFDAVAVVIGLPINLDGTEGAAAVETRRVCFNMSRSLDIPVYLQDERLTSRAAESELLLQATLSVSELKEQVDGVAATIILRDFISSPDKIVAINQTAHLGEHTEN